MASSRGFDKFSPNTPDAPYFAIKIEDRIYDIDHNYIESLSVQRICDDNGNFNFTIDNAADLNLENKFLALIQNYDDSYPPISIQYGWSLGAKSPWYRGWVENYNPEFLPGGYMRLGVTGKLCPPSDTLPYVAEFKGNCISDIVEAIALDKGWIIEEIEKTTPFSEERSFQVSNVDPVEYIRKNLEPYAVNSKKEPFKLYVETGDGGVTHVWFVSVNKQVGEYKPYNYYINFGNFGSVLSWAPHYDATRIRGFLQDAVFDLDTNDICVYGNEAKAASSVGATLTVYGATTPDRMGPLLANKWYQNNIGSLKASLTIVGDPTLVPLQFINVLPMEAPGSDAGGGSRLHRFTSGTYRIDQINDIIAADYQTQLELTMQGTEDSTKTMSLYDAVEFKGSE